MKKKTTSIAFVIAVATSCSVAFAQDTPARPRPRVSFDNVLRREDSNGDGKVTEAEFKAPPRLFKRFDRNGDGVLTKEDFAGTKNGADNRPPAARSAPEGVDVQRDVVFGKGGGRDLTMHIVLPKKRSDTPAPAYVWIHGGGWQGGTKEGGVGQVVPLVRSGFVGATIEYRLSGEAAFPADRRLQMRDSISPRPRREVQH